MLKTENLTADFLFAVQIAGGVVLGGSQFKKMLTDTTGVTFSWFILMEVFIAINVILAVNAHRVLPSRDSCQMVATYVMWLCITGTHIVEFAICTSGRWTMNDTITTTIVAGAVATTIAVSYGRGLGISDPITRGVIAVFFKAVPQFAVAYQILIDGSGNGLAVGAVLAGNITIMTRLGQLCFLIWKEGWNPNRVGSTISEVWNLLSWATVSIVWILH